MMPIYEYRCSNCGHEMEKTQTITSKPLKKCPSCKRMKLERLISRSTFILRGSNWYKDGYGKYSPNSKKED